MKSILVVDDSPSIRNMLKATLVPLGYRVTEAAGGRAGLEKIRQEKFDLIISDQNMPGMDGLNMVKSIRQSCDNTPILVLTTETSDEMKAAFRAAGANGWMSKPFTPERLEAALNKFLGN